MNSGYWTSNVKILSAVLRCKRGLYFFKRNRYCTDSDDFLADSVDLAYNSDFFSDILIFIHMGDKLEKSQADTQQSPRGGAGAGVEPWGPAV